MQASLSETIICNPPRSKIDLSCTDLEGDNLRGVDLFAADLKGAHLEGAGLRGAIMGYDQLAEASSLKGAIMPNGSTHP